MKVVVTGASGFLGSRLAAELVREGHQVVAGSRKPVPELLALGARHAPLDLADREALRNAFKDADIVFHVAAKTGVWGPEREYVESNVTGTQNVLAACEQRRVKRLVYTSSPSVVGFMPRLSSVGTTRTASSPSPARRAARRTLAWPASDT